jgi:hypothetical protein
MLIAQMDPGLRQNNATIEPMTWHCIQFNEPFAQKDQCRKAFNSPPEVQKPQCRTYRTASSNTIPERFRKIEIQSTGSRRGTAAEY